MKNVILIAFSCFILLACKKDKLRDDKSVFIGNWSWKYSNHTYGICTGDPPSEEILTPDSEGSNYSMEFFEKGIVKFFENGNKLNTKRIVFSNFGGLSCGYSGDFNYFNIHLDGKSEKTEDILQGCISPDTLIVIRGFPYDSYEDACEIYETIFVKE